MRARPLLLLLIMAVLSLGAAACGGDDDTEAADQAGIEETPAATATPEGEEGAGAGQEASGDTGADVGGPGEPIDVTGGTTRIRLNQDLERAFRAAGVNIQTVGEAQRQGEEIVVPIASGTFDTDTPSGEIRHAGGLSFSVAGQMIEASELVIQPEENVITASVNGQRVPLFRIDIGDIDEAGASDTFVAPATLSLPDGGVLDRLGLSALREGTRIGEATIQAR